MSLSYSISSCSINFSNSSSIYSFYFGVFLKPFIINSTWLGSIDTTDDFCIIVGKFFWIVPILLRSIVAKRSLLRADSIFRIWDLFSVRFSNYSEFWECARGVTSLLSDKFLFLYVNYWNLFIILCSNSSNLHYHTPFDSFYF